MSAASPSRPLPSSTWRDCCGLFLLGVVAVTCIFLLGSVAGAEPAPVPEFRVIVQRENPSSELTREFVSDAFLKRITRWSDGEALRPVDQSGASLVRRRFSERGLQRSVAAVKNYWQQRIFSGRDLPPPEVDSDDAVVDYVVKHRGALGYVSGTAKLDKVKAVVVQ